MNIRAKLLASAIVALIPASAMAGQGLAIGPSIEIQIGGVEVDTETAQADMPSAGQIQRSLEGQPRIKVRPTDRVTIREFKRRPELRRAAPSIDIQAINFAFGSADIPYSQYGKVENIAIALQGLLARHPHAKVLIEGHTDAVGSNFSNFRLSERRAASLKWTLVREFGIPHYALETVGYGEDFLLVPTPYEDWRNRRVSLRRYDHLAR
jgi:outer membrane protein OmpA-like peptidoglycan-associated protein